MISISGDIDIQETIKLFEQEFSSWQADGEESMVLLPPVNLPEKTLDIKNPVTGKNTIEIIMGHKGISRVHPDFYKFNLMNYIFTGAPLANRLNTNIRDKGLVL